ncbi:class I SAM-dependent methyltransferase [uncultured Jatrophihabitans sp.]|uniref:class I SAM-dependent methyltransferase n=1 Tax=uncultured Jatrophihabitans sp. TaxID=1610747 RepID=UPI0035CC12E0
MPGSAFVPSRGELHESDRPSSTAQWTTFGRTLELARPDEQRIVTDVYAPVFLSSTARALITPLRAAGPFVRGAERLAVAGVATSALCRHRFIDEHLGTAAREVAQVVILGAGYDSRAYRFAQEIGDRRVFEVDLAPLSRRKAEIVAANEGLFGHPAIDRVEIDFRTQSLDERLLDAGFETPAPTFVVWEGVSMYLTRDAVRETLTSLARLCGSGSTIAMDFWQHTGGYGPWGQLRRLGEKSVRLIGEPLDFMLPTAKVDDLFAAHHFDVVDRADAEEMAARYATAGRSCDPGMHVVAARRR